MCLVLRSCAPRSRIWSGWRGWTSDSLGREGGRGLEREGRIKGGEGREGGREGGNLFWVVDNLKWQECTFEGTLL